MLVAVLMLAVLPAAYLAARTGLLRQPGVRIGLLAASIALVLWSIPATTLDFTHAKRMNLLIAAATAAVVALRHAGIALRDRGAYRAALGTLAAVSVVTWLGFFSFHGQRTWVHSHDVAHYYLGSKYFRELGYGNLYTAMLRAEAEVYGNRFKTLEARDLHTGDLVHVRMLLQASEPVKAAFTPDRWIDFRVDVASFREALGPHHAALYADHGFNPTPLWPLLGGALANRVPAGSASGVLALTLLDPLLILAAFAAVGWAFGLETALLAVVSFCVTFGAGFGWTGGAFLRFGWFFAVAAGFAALGKGRHGTSGALFALAAVLRVFPAFFVGALALKAIGDALVNGGLERSYRRFFASFAATAAVLAALTVAAFGAGSWQDFRRNIAQHRTVVSPNVVGLTGLLAHHRGPALVTQDELRRIRDRRERIYRAQLMTAFALGVLLCAAAAPFLDDVAAAALGAPLLFLGLNLASYYYVFLVVLVIAHRAHPRRLVLVFAAEALSHVLLLFEEREATQYLFRSLVLAYLFAALALEQALGPPRRVKMEA